MTQTHEREPDRLDAAHQMLLASLQALVTSDDWLAMLDATRRFHSYSPTNVLLLLAQGAEGRVAGYRTWQRIPARDGGYCQVARGARGMNILAPLQRVVREFDPDAGEERVRPVLTGFKVVRVFDERALVSQPAIPEIEPALLHGNAPDALFQALRVRIEYERFSVEHQDCSPANGMTDWATRSVVVRPDLDAAQQAKTLAHELGHVLLHDPDELVKRKLTGMSRERKEVEAESVAWLVCTETGLTADRYTIPYVARWANGDLDLVRATAERVVNTARDITTELELSRGTEPRIALHPPGHDPADALGLRATAQPERHESLRTRLDRDVTAALSSLAGHVPNWGATPEEAKIVERLARSSALAPGNDAEQRSPKPRPRSSRGIDLSGI
jgi:hypothetical protein